MSESEKKQARADITHSVALSTACACASESALECSAARGGPRLSTPERCECDCHEIARQREVHEVKKTFHFEAAHRLPHHGGKCARLHGHSYRMTITLRGSELATGTGPSSGMLQDHADVSTVVMPLIQSNLDHYYLNESTRLENPTVELLCRWIWDKIEKKLPRLHSITIRETCTASYTYRRKKS